MHGFQFVELCLLAETTRVSRRRDTRAAGSATAVWMPRPSMEEVIALDSAVSAPRTGRSQKSCLLPSA